MACGRCNRAHDEWLSGAGVLKAEPVRRGFVRGPVVYVGWSSVAATLASGSVQQLQVHVVQAHVRGQLCLKG
jgi:hypothetical protein